MEYQSKATVREFSKKHNVEARKDAVEIISKKRHEHFDKKKSLDREVFELQETIKKHETE